MGDSGQVAASASAGGSSPLGYSSTPAAQAAAGTTTTTKATNPGGNWGAMALTGFGGLSAINSQLTTGKVNQRIAEDNATITKVEADQTLQAGAFAAGRAETRGRQVEGAQRAAQGGGGVVTGAGTAGVATAETVQASAMNGLMIQRNAARAALGLDIKAGEEQMQGVEAAAKGRQDALGTLLNTGAQEWLESDPSYGGRRGSGINFV